MSTKVGSTEVQFALLKTCPIAGAHAEDDDITAEKNIILNF